MGCFVTIRIVEVYLFALQKSIYASNIREEETKNCSELYLMRDLKKAAMSFDENDLMNREFLEERHNTLLNELKLLCNKLPETYQQKMSESFLSELANSLLDKTVFDIVKNLKDIQVMTENNLLERRMKLIYSHDDIKEKMIECHKEALTNEIRVNPRNAEVLRARQIAEFEATDKQNENELNHLDMKIIMELDQTVSDQQITLEKVGVPGFFVTNKPADVKLQMHLLEFITILSIKDGIE